MVEDFEAFGKRFRMDVHGAQGEQACLGSQVFG